MRKKATILALLCIIITGCSINQHCDAYSDQQCDEMYPYYNCDHPQMYSYTPRNYRKHIRHNSYTPGYNGYYPNTQTIYYAPVYIDQNCNEPNVTTRGPRPSNSGRINNNSGNNAVEITPPGAHRRPTSSASSSRKKRD
jgi:hypothetical protein